MVATSVEVQMAEVSVEQAVVVAARLAITDRAFRPMALYNFTLFPHRGSLAGVTRA